MQHRAMTLNFSAFSLRIGTVTCLSKQQSNVRFRSGTRTENQQQTQPTSCRPVREWSPGHIGGRRVLSLRHPGSSPLLRMAVKFLIFRIQLLLYCATHLHFTCKAVGFRGIGRVYELYRYYRIILLFAQNPPHPERLLPCLFHKMIR